VPFVQTTDIAGLFAWLCRNGFKRVGTSPHGIVTGYVQNPATCPPNES
jgi:hypothetical protein